MWNRPETTFPRRNPTNRALTPNHDRFGIISLINSFKMKTKQAKDFLVQQTAEQAARESVPLSERSEEHTSELQSRLHLVCRLLLEKKKKANALTQLCYFTT